MMRGSPPSSVTPTGEIPRSALAPDLSDQEHQRQHEGRRVRFGHCDLHALSPRPRLGGATISLASSLVLR
jgi:hypothetical protein